MADFTALKTAIQNAIKQNGNEEITGNLLQEVLLAIVTTLGDGSINDLITALGSEATTRQQADGTLQQNINAEAQARQLADSTLQGGINTVSAAITAINNAITNGCVYAGIATPSSTPASGKVFYLAFTAGTYTHFNSLEVPQGINILKNNGSTWLLDSFLGIDDAPTPSSNKLVKSGGVFNDIMTNGSAFDLTAYNNGTTYADLNAALTALNALPAAYKKGGMSMKFVQTSDNKYVQCRLMTQNFSITESDWQGVDDEPTADSDNLVKSGGVANKTGYLNQITDAIQSINLPTLGKVSVIGDSISSFAGTQPEGWAYAYPQQDVISVNQMWWDLILKNCGGVLEVNAAYSGSCSSKYSNDYPSFYERVDDLGTPDTIFIALGTNDCYGSIELGEYDYDAAIADLSETEFIPSYIKGLKGLKELYPSANIYLFVFQMHDVYSGAIENIGNHYGYKVIDCRKYINTRTQTDDNVHPNKHGMEVIARTFVDSFSDTYTKEIVDSKELGSVVFSKMYNARIVSTGRLVLGHYFITTLLRNNTSSNILIKVNSGYSVRIAHGDSLTSLTITSVISNGGYYILNNSVITNSYVAITVYQLDESYPFDWEKSGLVIAEEGTILYDKFTSNEFITAQINRNKTTENSLFLTDTYKFTINSESFIKKSLVSYNSGIVITDFPTALNNVGYWKLPVFFQECFEIYVRESSTYRAYYIVDAEGNYITMAPNPGGVKISKHKIQIQSTYARYIYINTDQLDGSYIKKISYSDLDSPVAIVNDNMTVNEFVAAIDAQWRNYSILCNCNVLCFTPISSVASWNQSIEIINHNFRKDVINYEMTFAEMCDAINYQFTQPIYLFADAKTIPTNDGSEANIDWSVRAKAVKSGDFNDEIDIETRIDGTDIVNIPESEPSLIVSPNGDKLYLYAGGSRQCRWESTDGLLFTNRVLMTDENGNPGPKFTDGITTSPYAGIDHKNVNLIDGIYYMVGCGHGRNGEGAGHAKNTLVLHTSTDGIQFTFRGVIFMPNTHIRENMFPGDAEPDLVANYYGNSYLYKQNNKWYLYFEIEDNVHNRWWEQCIATCDDILHVNSEGEGGGAGTIGNWDFTCGQAENPNPIFSDDDGVGRGYGNVDFARGMNNLPIKHDGKYYLYLHGAYINATEQLNTTAIYRAYSEDLIHWVNEGTCFDNRDLPTDTSITGNGDHAIIEFKGKTYLFYSYNVNHSSLDLPAEMRILVDDRPFFKILKLKP